jgi:membrane-associated protease RseP (regulator of RpoE activity)
MSWNFRYLRRYGTIAGAAIVGVGLSGSVHAQTLPIAGNPQQANATERDAIRGVREQDDAAARVSAQLNGSSPGAASGATANNMDELLRAGILIDARDPNRLNVQRVLPNSPAARAGLRPGDVITRVNGSPVTSLTAVAQALLSGNTGALGLQVDRNGQSRQLNVSMPDTSARLAALTQTGGQPGASNTQAPMTVGGAVVPGTATSATPGPGGLTPALGTTTAQTAGGQAIAAGQPAGVGQGTATAQGTAAAPAFSSQAGGTSQPTTTTGGTTTAPITTPFPASAATLGNPTSPGLLVQPNTTSGLPTSTPGVRTSVPGLPTSTPGISPSPGTGSGGATPSITSSQGTVNPSVGGGTSALSGTSGLTPSAVSSSQGGLNPSIGGGTPGTAAATGTGTTGTTAAGTTGSTGAAGSSAAGGTAGGTGTAGGGAAGGSGGAGAGGAGAGGAGAGGAGAGGT